MGLVYQRGKSVNRLEDRHGLEDCTSLAKTMAARRLGAATDCYGYLMTVDLNGIRSCFRWVYYSRLGPLPMVVNCTIDSEAVTD